MLATDGRCLEDSGEGRRCQRERHARAYLDAYRRNAKLMKLLEQVATIDDRFFEVRRSRTAAFVERNARGIRRPAARGEGRPVTGSAAGQSGAVVNGLTHRLRGILRRLS